MKTTVRLIWLAAADRVGHASLPKARRTLCGSTIVAERDAWPKLRRCASCRVAAEDLGWQAPS